MANVTVEVRTLESGKHSGQYGGAAPDALLALAARARLAARRARRRRGRRAAARRVGRRAAARGGLPRARHGPRRDAADRHRRARVARLVGPGDHRRRDRRAVGRRRRQRGLAVRARRAQRARASRAGCGRGAGGGHRATCARSGRSASSSTCSRARPATASPPPPAGPAYDAAREAWSAAWGRDVLLAGSGGSIPIVSALAQALPDAEALLVGDDRRLRQHPRSGRAPAAERVRARDGRGGRLPRPLRGAVRARDGARDERRGGTRRRHRRVRRARGRLHPARASPGSRRRATGSPTPRSSSSACASA